jgi:hypothetical protein
MGNLPEIIKLTKQIASGDQIKDVLPKGPEGLEKLRDIEGAVSSAGQQAQQALGQIMSQASAAMGGLQSVMSQMQSIINSGGRQSAAPTIPTGSYAATHEEAAAATDQSLENLQEYINTLQTLDAALETLDFCTAPITAFQYHNTFLERMHNISDAYDTLKDYDLSVLGVKEINNLCSGMTRVMGILAAVPEIYIADYNLSKMVYASPRIMEDLYFYGIDIGQIHAAATTLIAALRAADPERLGSAYVEQFSYAATILENKLNQEWTLTDSEQCVADAVHYYYPLFLAMLQRGTPPSYKELTDLIKKMMDAITACSATKQLGSPMGSTSNVPQIGSMVDSVLNDFLKKSILDKGKIQELMQKYTKKMNIAEQKRNILKSGMNDKDESAKGAQADSKPPSESSKGLSASELSATISKGF